MHGVQGQNRERTKDLPIVSKIHGEVGLPVKQEIIPGMSEVIVIPLDDSVPGRLGNSGSGRNRRLTQPQITVELKISQTGSQGTGWWKRCGDHGSKTSGLGFGIQKDSQVSHSTYYYCLGDLHVLEFAMGQPRECLRCPSRNRNNHDNNHNHIWCGSGCFVLILVSPNVESPNSPAYLFLFDLIWSSLENPVSPPKTHKRKDG